MSLSLEVMYYFKTQGALIFFLGGELCFFFIIIILKTVFHIAQKGIELTVFLRLT